MIEPLEARDVPAVALHALDDLPFPGGKDLLVPLSAIDDTGDFPIAYSVASSNSSVTATVIPGGTYINLRVTGTNPDNTTFDGNLVIRLFDDIAPTAVAQILDLVGDGFYNGKLFHRVVDGFMAQGGSANGNGTGNSGNGIFDDEFDAATTFVSPGVVALANAGDDGNDSQFFIVDRDVPLADLPQHLNFNHSIVGLLVFGFGIYNKITHVDTVPQNPPLDNEDSKPVQPVTIESATVLTNTRFGALRISAPANFTGTSTITVTATAIDNSTDTEDFEVTVVPDTVNDRAFLGQLADIATNMGTAITFDAPTTDLEGDALTLRVGSPGNLDATPANISVSINNTTKRITITPNAGFTGTVELLIGVRDQTNRSGTPNLNAASNFDTQQITLTVNGNIDLDAASDTGIFNDDNFTGDDTPSLTIRADPGNTVTVSVNGAGSFATTEGPAGTYKVTLPAETLKLGTNTISATNSNQQPLAPLDIVFAPSQQSVFIVPGDVGSAQSIEIKMISRETFYQSELGFFLVDDLQGTINGIAPGAAGYLDAAMNARQVLMAPEDVAGRTVTVPLQGGQIIAFYLIQGASSAEFLAANATNSLTQKPRAFFSILGANADATQHAMVVGDASRGQALYGWEDLQGGGDRDYNDMVVAVQALGAPTVAQALRVGAGSNRDVTLTIQLQAAIKSFNNPDQSPNNTAIGEIGYFEVDDRNGSINGLQPGDPGWVEAALNARQVLFNLNDPTGVTRTHTLPGGTLIGFYLVPNSSGAALLATNPTNDPAGLPLAYFSFDAANPDGGANHFRTFNPERVGQDLVGEGAPIRVHAMGQTNGTADSFDDALFTIGFGA
jgi:cyclophilin family peptidyl-prolyl cis-trans isomerase